MKKKKSNLPVILLIAGGLLLIGAVLSFALSGAGEEEVAQAPADDSGHDVFPEIERITVTDAKAAFDSGAAVFLDTRDADSFALSHIPGAVLIPLPELESRLDGLDSETWIITYCT